MPSRSDFQEVKFLGDSKNGGNNRGVYLVKLKTTGKNYIEKRIGQTAIKSGYGEREVRMMLQCWGHPNIIRIKSHDMDYKMLGYGSIFMQSCELGSLDGLIRRYAAKEERLVDEGCLWKVFWDTSLALSHLVTGADPKDARKRALVGKTIHAIQGWKTIAHMDIKPGNIFLTDEDSLGADKTHFPTHVLGDFGCSKSKSDVLAGRASRTRISGETPGFAPPEPTWNERGDIYALGVTIHCLGQMSNRPDLKHHHPLSPRYKDENLRKLIKQCIKTNPHDRPSSNDLPALVWQGYVSWRKKRGNDGAKLQKWALPCSPYPTFRFQRRGSVNL